MGEEISVLAIIDDERALRELIYMVFRQYTKLYLEESDMNRGQCGLLGK